MYDSLNMHSLESSLIDIMRAEQDPLKGKTYFLIMVCWCHGSRIRLWKTDCIEEVEVHMLYMVHIRSVFITVLEEPALCTDLAYFLHF